MKVRVELSRQRKALSEEKARKDIEWASRPAWNQGAAKWKPDMW